MEQQDGQAASEFTLFALAHALDFLGNVLNIGEAEFSRSQQGGLFISPGIEILFVKLAQDQRTDAAAPAMPDGVLLRSSRATSDTT